MNELYHLDTDVLPSMPTPHDCVIKTILVDKEKQLISFVFEDNLSEYDSYSSSKTKCKVIGH